MQIYKKSKNHTPKVSLILLDWGVRESFHLCHYLSMQNIPRDQFEIILVDYYTSPSKAAKAFEEQIDAWCLLEMPKDSYYHKHLMYNVGFFLSHGEIIVICDSDAMVKPTFIESIINHFEKNPDSILHLDQFRNHRKDFYPFNYPSFESVIGAGCINYLNGVTTGIAATSDLIHKRNYGACFCCKREDYIAIEGADEHIDYVGHICGPYDLTFRLINLGKKEIWHTKEFLYHTWHPGSDGIDNYMGPHDGYNMSTNAIESLFTGRIYPHVVNLLMQRLKEGNSITEEDALNDGISHENFVITKNEFLRKNNNATNWSQSTRRDLLVDHYVIRKKGKAFEAYLLKKVRGAEDLSLIEPEYSHSIYQKVKKYAQKKSTNTSIKTGFAITFKLIKNYGILYLQKAKTYYAKTLDGKQKVARRFSHIKLIAKTGSLPWEIYKKMSNKNGEVLIIVNSQRDLYIYEETLRTQTILFQTVQQLIKKEKTKIKVKLLDSNLIKNILEKPKEFHQLFVTPGTHQDLEKINTKIKMTVI